MTSGTLVLSLHAGYACRHRGACCRAGWPIPVEADRLPAIVSALDTGALAVVPEAGAPQTRGVPLERTGGTAEPPAFVGLVGGRCVFRHEDERGGRCEVHRVLGHGALPLACRQFPRVSVLDPRGASVTLSHYCPTAREMLEGADAPVRILTSPAGFPADGEYVGLDARDGLPPLLRPNLLMDWESWWAWEAWSVDVLANSPLAPGDALSTLAAAVDRLLEWTPAAGTALSEAVRYATEHLARTDRRAALRSVEGQGPRAKGPALRRRGLVNGVRAAVPAGLEVPEPSGAVIDAAVLKRLLAAHAFANWMPHLGRGLRAWLRWLEAVYALAQSGYDVSQVDLLMRHLVDPGALAEAWRALDSTPPP
jgi:Fe-S-cluster containining protein